LGSDQDNTALEREKEDNNNGDVFAFEVLSFIHTSLENILEKLENQTPSEHEAS